jgi:hypothetical protein
VPCDLGRTDANLDVTAGISALAIGAVIAGTFRRTGEYAESSSIVPAIESLMAFAIGAAAH